MGHSDSPVYVRLRHQVLKRFLDKRPRLAPRQKKRLFAADEHIKGFALLNVFSRQRISEDTIVAAASDIESGFRLYEPIAEPNEMGISPETYRIYKDIIVPLAVAYAGAGFPRTEIVKKHLKSYGRPLPWDRLTK